MFWEPEITFKFTKHTEIKLVDCSRAFEDSLDNRIEVLYFSTGHGNDLRTAEINKSKNK